MNNIEKMQERMDRVFKRETPKSFRRWLHKHREDAAARKKEKVNYLGELEECKKRLEENIRELVEDFNGNFPGMFVYVEHTISTSNYSDHHNYSVSVTTSINTTGKPVKF